MNENVKRNRWPLWLGVITVFVVGLLIGGLSATVLMRSHVLHIMRTGSPRPHERIAERLTGNLGLAADQRARTEEIVREFQPRFEEFEQRSRAEVKSIAGEMETRIREILTPEERVKFDANIAKIREEMTKRERREHGGQPGEPGGPR